MGSASKVSWEVKAPDKEGNWLVSSNSDAFGQLLAMAADGNASLFKKASTGAKSNRDEIVYEFDQQTLTERVASFIGMYNAEVDRWKHADSGTNLDAFLEGSKVKWSSTLKGRLKRGQYAACASDNVRLCLYRPYTKTHLYYDDILNDRPGLFRFALPNAESQTENVVICCTNHSQSPFSVIATNVIANEAVGGRAGTCFPFYLYDADGSNRRENITDWALKQFRECYTDRKLTKWDIFYYAYALLHHTGYRTKFADNLKKNLPRIPFAPDFRAFATAGKELADLHLEYEQLSPYPLEYLETRGMPLSYVVDDRMRLSNDKTRLQVNASLTLAGIPPKVFEYRLGKRSALEWVIAQHQVTEDARTGIRSDPNRANEPEYIVSLVCQIVKVSLETVEIVNSLPKAYSNTQVSEQVDA
jgi:predicted helicase